MRKNKTETKATEKRLTGRDFGNWQTWLVYDWLIRRAEWDDLTQIMLKVGVMIEDGGAEQSAAGDEREGTVVLATRRLRTYVNELAREHNLQVCPPSVPLPTTFKDLCDEFIRSGWDEVDFEEISEKLLTHREWERMAIRPEAPGGKKGPGHYHHR